MAGRVEVCLTVTDVECEGTQYSGGPAAASGSVDVFDPLPRAGVSGASVIVVVVASRGSRK